MQHASRFWLVVSSFVLCAVSSSARAADFYADVGASGSYDSNVYLDSQKEWDFKTSPHLGLGLLFADCWMLGYDGQMDLYARHADLLFHQHEIFLAANPSWGADRENGFFAEIGIATQRNTETYAAIDLNEPILDLGLNLEPVRWFRWSLSERASYRWFYNDTASDSVDSWTRTSMTFTLPSRTTIGPRIALGYRHHARVANASTDEKQDIQIEAGAHLSQSLWASGGLRADYAYLHSIGKSGLILRGIESTELSFIGEEFLYTGHRALLGFKQIFESGWRFGWELVYETREYHGWPVVDENGNETRNEREDDRLSPRGWIEYVFWPDETMSRAVPTFSMSLDFIYLRQWSSDAWYDTDRVVSGLELDLGW